jgi:ferredoxin-NADP reductase
MIKKIKVRVRSITELSDRIRSYELVSPIPGRALPPFTAGSHVTVFLPSGAQRQYSLENDQQETHRYSISVQREDAGKGGSKEIHSKLHVGGMLDISHPKNHFPMDDKARTSVLIAGGIGITPILSMARLLTRTGNYFSMLCLARDKKTAAFYDQVQGLKGNANSVTWHFDNGDPSKGFDLNSFLSYQEVGAHLYCCGPLGLMDAVQSAAAHWSNECVHFEYFSNGDVGSSDDDSAFTVIIPRIGKTVEVLADQTIVEALKMAGVDVDYSCLEGTCGTCIVKILEGVADHRDKVLMDSELGNYIVVRVLNRVSLQ